MELLVISLPQLIARSFSGHILEGTVIELVLFLLFLFMLIKNKGLHPQATGVLITVGICFTFYGISMGLADFDSNDIDKNLPVLIEGIKTAFLVSVLGVFFSIILRLIAMGMEFFHKEEVVEEGMGAEDIVALQHQSLNVIKDQAKLIAGLKDSNDKGFAMMAKSFEEFARTMAENNSKAFIKALEEVIKDFNNKITEQFGDNFKQLNIAVGKLLEWQKNYKDYIERSEKNLNFLQATIDKATKDYAVVVTNSKTFTENAMAMKAVLEEGLKQREALEKNVQNLAAFLSKVQETIPTLLRDMNNYQNASLQSLQQIKELSGNLEKHYLDITTRLTTSIENSLGSISANFKENADKLTSTLGQITAELGKGSKDITAQIKVLDDELENILKGLSSNLASISSRFVDDYQKIISYLNVKAPPKATATA